MLSGNTDSYLHGDDAARFMVVWLVGVVLVQRVQLWVGLVAEGLVSHSAEVKMEAVQEKINSDLGPSGLCSHSRGRTQDEGRAVDYAASLKLEKSKREHKERGIKITWNTSSKLLYIVGLPVA